MKNPGIIVGCDQDQEWLLPWWWYHYSRYNSYPVAFADFGMSLDAILWCSQRGSVLNIPHSSILQENKISLSKKNSWEKLYGEGIWSRRFVWFKKPSALLQSPFDWGIWLDLDCQVRANLDPIFRALTFGAEIGAVQEPFFVQECEKQNSLLLPGEVSYNSGVIVFRQNADILHRWREEIRNFHEKYAGDQAALSRVIFLYCQDSSFIQLPAEYNWLRLQGPNQESLIHHFTGSQGKAEILKNMEYLGLRGFI